MEGVFIKVFVFITLFLQVEGRATAQCVQVGQARIDEHTSENVFTIGGKDFKPRHPLVLDWYPRTSGKTSNSKIPSGPNGVPIKFYYQAEAILKGKGDDWKEKTCYGYPFSDGGYTYNTGYEEGDRPVNGTVAFPYTEECSDKVDINVYLVRQRGITLSGWLYIEVKLTPEADQLEPYDSNLKGKPDSMELIYVQVRDEDFNAIGEFVSDPKEQCPLTDKTLIRPTEYQMMPCSATGAREAKTSQAIFMAKRAQYPGSKVLKYMPKKELNRGIGFMWRLNEYWCNRHQKFRIDAFVWTHKNELSYKASINCFKPKPGVKEDLKKFATLNEWKKSPVCRTYQKKTHWFKPKWFGASDIMTPGEALDCRTLAHVGQRNWKKINPLGLNWLNEDFNDVKIGEDYVADTFLKYNEVYNSTTLAKLKLTEKATAIYKLGQLTFIRGCQVNPIKDGNREVASSTDIETFGGRCRVLDTKKPSPGVPHTCNNDASSHEFQYVDVDLSTWQKYSSYHEELSTGRLEYCNASQECVYPITDEDFKEIMRYPDEEKKNKTAPKVSKEAVKQLRVDLDVSRDTTFWYVRKYHASLCVFFTMFIMPVCLVISRYYKETFMSAKGTLPVWVWSHIFMCISVLTLFRSSFTAMREHIYNWGRQDETHSNLHRGFGYFFVGLFSLMICLGLFRPLKKTARHVICTLHSVIGFGLYLIALILIMSSPSIPGSPSVDKCFPENANETNISHSVTGYAIGWLVFDIIFHASLTSFQIVMDRRMSVNRTGFGLPFIPFLPYTSLQDFPGSLVRKIALGIYIAIAFIMTMVTMADIFDKDLYTPEFENCKPRNLTCDVGKNPFGCSELNQLYFEIVKKRYNLSDSDFML